jgi:hypothetical protein
MMAGSSCLLMEDGQKSLADWIEERREEVDQPFSSQIIEKVVRFVIKHAYSIYFDAPWIIFEGKPNNCFILVLNRCNIRLKRGMRIRITLMRIRIGFQIFT